MTGEIIVAIFGLLGTTIGSIAGIIASNKTVNFRLQAGEARIEAIEEKAEEHSALRERITVLESKMKSAAEQIREIQKEINQLKGGN
jgi:predicted nuclease with TOPRIM domain